jgi:hypothetical protein
MTGPSPKRRCASDIVVANIMKASDTETSCFMIGNPDNLTLGAQPRAGFARFDLCRRDFRLVGCSALFGSLLEPRMYERRTLFTLAPSGKASATSGSSSTIVVPAVARA